VLGEPIWVFLVDKVALGQVILLVLHSSSAKRHPPISLSHPSSAAGTIGPFAAAVQREAAPPFPRIKHRQ
jgi:hypothetical protein